jgi:glucose-1-phosphate thymidylyltransferase
MKGVLLAGGTGSRLLPLTKVTNKHLLPVYNKPMIYYPLETLKSMGIKEILIISGPEHCGHILNLLGSGREQGLTISYEIQDNAGGIAQALGLAKNFAGNEDIAVILGDNIFQDSFDIKNFKEGARVFIKEVNDPKRFAVAEIEGNKIKNMEEKPENPKSNYAVTGLYIYDNKVFDIIKTLKPSGRGELEITDVNNAYVQQGKMSFSMLDGYWSDAGTFESLHRASTIVKENL